MKRKTLTLGLISAALATALFGLTATATADPVQTARGSAFGIEVGGPVELSARPTAEVVFPGGDHAEDTLLDVPADPVVTSATLHVEADVARESTIEARLQDVIEGEFAGAPGTWNARGYAITEDLSAVSDTVTADVVESESTAACVGGDIVYGSATRIVNLAVAGTNVPIINPSPNEVVFDQLGIRIVMWETNWDPATGGLTEGDVLFTNALHITAPGDIDIVVSHSEAEATCAGPDEPEEPDEPDEPEPPPPDAPPAAPVPGQPTFTG